MFVENYLYFFCYFKGEKILVDLKFIFGIIFEIKVLCVFFDKEEFDCFFNIVFFWL